MAPVQLPKQAAEPSAPLMSLPVFCFLENRMTSGFPNVELALDEPDGLLAAGGDLSAESLLNAYRRGIFPWYEPQQPVLWWCPDPRAILLPGKLHISRSLARQLRRPDISFSFDTAFNEVIETCASIHRPGQHGTWLTREMISAYQSLHRLGHAHSAECWSDGELIGGLYGIAIGKVFFGESMFSRRDNGSKMTMAALCQRLDEWGYELIDCQLSNPHLVRMGATSIPRHEFIEQLERLCPAQVAAGAWQS